METKANYVAVGVFTLFAVLAAFGFVWWTAGIGEGGETAMLRVRIPGSASGLGRGSAVLFNGVKVGDVRRVYIDVSNPSVAIADTEVDRLTPITASTEADIGIAGLTGQANIELKGGDPNQPNLLDVAAAEDKIAEITADPSAVTNLLQTAQDIFRRADTVLVELEGFVTETREPLTQTVRNVEQFSQALGRNAEGIDTFLANFAKLSDALGSASERLDTTLAAAEEILRAVDTEKVEAVVSNVETFTQTLRDSTDELERVVAGVDVAVGAASTFAQNANTTLSRVDSILQGVQPGQVGEAVSNIAAASETVRQVASDVREVTAKVNAEDVEAIVSNVETFTQTLRDSTDELERVMTGVDVAVGAVSSFAQNANTTLSRVDGILQGVEPGKIGEAVRNIEAASETARQVATDVREVTSTVKSEDVEQIVTNAKQLTERLAEASVRVDGILVKVDNLLGSGEAEGVIAEATETLRAFRQVADTLNARIGPITDGLARFAGEGLRDVEALVGAARRSITRIEQAITDFERNPQRIITGGEGTVREFDGRVRR